MNRKVKSKDFWADSWLSSLKDWKMKARICSVCGKKMKEWGAKCTKKCEKIKTENMRALIEENKRLEDLRRAKPATIGDIEDMLKELRDSNDYRD